jgi:FkbM family methyltransferase
MISRYFLRLIKPFNYIRSFGFYKQFVGVNKLFFDIGANIGDRSEIFSRLGVKVVSVEPQPDCVHALEKRFSDSDVVVVNKGVGREQGEMRMNVCADENGLSTFSKKWQTGRFKNFTFDKEIVVSMTTLDELIHEYGYPDFCKIDVEGFELEVLSGLTKKINCLNFEFTSEFFEDTKKCIERLTSIGFTQFNFTRGENPHLRLNPWVDKESLFAVIEENIKNNSDLWGDIYAR